MTPSRAARDATEKGCELIDARKFVEGIPYHLAARRLAPDWYAPWFHLGIAFKHARRWDESLECSLRALELDAEKAGIGASWNVGIAATALGDWPRARRAWADCGIEIPAGSGPIEMGLGVTPVRVNREAHPEVVWCDRIDPARAIIESVPTPESNRRYGDLVLHDGEPRGTRRHGESNLAVFDELAVLKESPYQTWCVRVVAPLPDDLSALLKACTGIDGSVEDWSENLRILCEACSLGTCTAAHETGRNEPWQPERRLGVAIRDQTVLERFAGWSAGASGRKHRDPERLL